MKEFLKKRILLLVSLVVFTVFFVPDIYSQQNWSIISRPTNQSLWRCSFVDTLNGWAVGDSGLIMRTSNGGYNWTMQNSKLNAYMVSVFFLNNRLGWAVGWGLDPNFFGTYILTTTNGGVVWDTARYPVYDVYVKDIVFLDSLTGYIGGVPGIFHKTTNGGLNWTKCNLDSNIASGFPVNRFRFLNSRIGIAVGGAIDIAGVIWKTTNYGQFWSSAIVAPEPINDIKLFDSVNYLAVGGDYEYGASVLKTTNGGVNWVYKTLEMYGIPRALAFRTNSEGWAPMGYLPNFIMTTDVGSTWSILDSPDTTKIFDLVFKSSSFGIGVCSYGYVIKYFSSPAFSVAGNVKYNDNNQPVTSGMVKAFKLDKSSGHVVVLDSAMIQPDGTYTLGKVPKDSVNIGVFPNSTPPNDWVITYYPSTIYWQEAAVLYPTGNLNDINIRAIRLLNTVANNSVNGKIMQHNSIITENIKDAVVYAKNGDAFVRCTVSDANGVYHLLSLPSGNIKIIVNRLGYKSDSTMVVVTPTSNIDSVNFYLHKIYIGINKTGNNIPSDYKLYQNYPNPFNPSTKIKFVLPKNSFTTLKVFDVLGREVALLVNEKLDAGEYEINFSINNFPAKQFPSGIYFYRIQAGDYAETKKMILLK